MSVNKLILNEFELYSKATTNTENCSLKKNILDKNSDHQISNTRDFINLDIEKIPDALYIWAATK